MAGNTDTDYVHALFATDATERSVLSLYSGVVFLGFTARVYSAAEIFDFPDDDADPIIPFFEESTLCSSSEKLDQFESMGAWRDWRLNLYLISSMGSVRANSP